MEEVIEVIDGEYGSIRLFDPFWTLGPIAQAPAEPIAD